MSSDYRPRGGSSSGGSRGSGRRRRGGRGRGGAGRSSSGEHRSHSNGHVLQRHAPRPRKKKNPIAAFFSWITGGGKKRASSRPCAAWSPASTTTDPTEPRIRALERPERADRGERTSADRVRPYGTGRASRPRGTARAGAAGNRHAQALRGQPGLRGRRKATSSTCSPRSAR